MTDRVIERETRSRVTGYCCLRLPVRDLQASIDFYCNVVGYVRAQPDTEVEAYLETASNCAPALYLMAANDREFRHIHWEQWGKLYSPFELLVDDIHALEKRLGEAEVVIHRETETERGGYRTMGFFDPDGHYLFAVDQRGRYFSLRREIEAALGRELNAREDALLERACVQTEARDEMFIVHSVIGELSRA